MKNFVKARDTTGEGFKYLRDKFPNLSDAKISAGVFVGPQIRKLMLDDNFDSKLNSPELAAWTVFKCCAQHFGQ